MRPSVCRGGATFSSAVHNPCRNHMKKLVLLLLAFLAACETPLQRPDPDFDASVPTPAFKEPRPLLLFDEAHHNFHSVSGLYAPFGKLVSNDGFELRVGRKAAAAQTLAPARIYVVAGARGPGDTNETPAFTDAETAAIFQWVQQGGSLLLIADHYPFGSAASGLAARFGVQFAPGMVEDSIQFDSPSSDRSQLVFSRQNGLLGSGPLTAGIDRVVSFTGTSLRGPDSASVFLRLSATAYDLQPNVQVQKDGSDSRVTVTYERPAPATGKAQGIAFRSGRGRVVVLGEAALLTAQLNRDNKPVGMNYNAGNKRLALNILHWLAEK
jgi:hypothetical protein